MVLLLLRCLATLLHAAAMFGLAPLLCGLLGQCRARLLGRRGPPVLQSYRDLRKLILKTPLIPDTATALYKVWPFAGFAAIAAAALLVPGFSLDLLTARYGDLVTVIGLLALTRAAEMLGGLEAGLGFGGAGASRQALFGIFIEAGFLIVLLALVLITGEPTLDGIAQFLGAAPGLSVSLGFALAALLAVALADTGRLAVGDTAGQQELAMVHEAMLLEYSGGYLALLRYTASLRLMVWFSLIGILFLPFGMAQAGAILSWPLGVACWALKLILLAAALSLLEVCTAGMRVFRVPQFLSMALLLGVLSVIFLFVAGRASG